MAVLMNGKNVEHLIINGDSFDKSYKGKSVEINNDIYSQSWVDYDGNYHLVTQVDGIVVPKGTKGYVVAFKFYNCFFIMRPKEGGGVWAQGSDIKILD